MSRSNPHSRNASGESSKSTSSGASYQLILEHMLSYPGTYEIPLRTMYTLNCAPRAQPPMNPLSRSNSRGNTPASSLPNSPTSPTFPYDQQTATAQFTSALMTQISQLPSQPCSLPPTFVTSFLNRCFPVELHLVDFPQSLTALDYLKDLETRRRKEIVYTLTKLGVDKDFLSSAAADKDLSRWNPTVADWLRSLETKERKVDALYTQLYIALRRWILVNEMSLAPFSRHNCHAMLNTLYPPVMAVQPTKKLTEETLMAQREGFFKYIQTVERRGVSCLETLIKQGRKDDEPNGWLAVKRNLTQYLTLANSIINECWDVNSIPQEETVVRSQPPKARMMQESEKRNGRKVDSGFSFGSDGKHSKNNSTSTSKSAAFSETRYSETPIGKGGSTLERIAREFKKMRPKTRVEVTEMIPQRSYAEIEKENSPHPVPPQKSKGVSRLRKMKSLGALDSLRNNNSSSASLKSFHTTTKGAKSIRFDPREMNKQRDAFDRKAGAL